MKINYQTSGTCSRAIELETDGENIIDVTFVGGCKGNTTGVAALVKGMPVSEVIEKLKGIQCRNNTSCPDQLATALEQLALRQAS